MAAITAGVVTAAAAASSAYTSHRAASAQERAQRRAEDRLSSGQFGHIGFGSSVGDNPFGNYDPETGRITTGLGDRLTGQLGQVDAFAEFFANQMGGNPLGDAFGSIAAQRDVAFNQPQTNLGLFDNLQGRTQGALGLAGLQLGAAGQDAIALNPFGNLAFGVAGQQLGDIGNFEDVRSRQLDLLRQQAAPFEDRAFTGLLDNQFATGRLGSSGGALQTEAFARGLGQADLARQLAASDEARSFQQNALGLAQGAFGLGAGQRGLSDSLLSSAFGNFGNLAGLSADIENSRFSQASSAQTNFFNQLGLLGQNQTALAQANLGLQSGGFQNFLAALSAGQAINDIPMDLLQQTLAFEQARSNAAIGSGSAQLGVQVGQSSDALASAFGGLSQWAQGGFGGFGNMFGGQAGNSFTTSNFGGQNFFSPSTFGGSGPVISEGAFGSNPFAGMFGGG